MRTIWGLILLLTVNTLYAQPDLKTRLGAFFAGQSAAQTGYPGLSSVFIPDNQTR